MVKIGKMKPRAPSTSRQPVVKISRREDRLAAVVKSKRNAEPTLHLIKLCVGVSEIQELADWQKQRRKKFKRRYNWHITRSYPRRAEELAAGGSLYWVIAGSVRVRQRIVAVAQRRDRDGKRCCELRLDPKLIETAPRAQRAFQGWRYLAPNDAPPDLKPGRKARGDRLPPSLVEELRSLGLL